MCRNLRALGLTFAVLLTTSMAAAPAATAQQGFFTSDGPMTFDASQVGGLGANALTTFGERMECPGSTFTGHRLATTPHQMIPSGATAITFTPHYKSPCTLSSGKQMTISMNGCDYALHVGTTVWQDQYSVTTDLVCPEGKDIEVELFSSSKHEAGTRICTRTIRPQVGIPGGRLTSTTGSSTLDLVGTFNLHLEQSGACGTATTTTGAFHVDVTLKGTSSIGAPTGVLVTDLEGGQGKITSDGPVTLTGTETGVTGSSALTAFGVSAECPGSTYAGHKVGSAGESVKSGATAMTITPSYKQPCVVGTRVMTVAMNGCDYVLNLGETAGGSDTYSVTTDVICPEGQSIRFDIWNSGAAHESGTRFCTLTIKPQTGLAGAQIRDFTTSQGVMIEGAFEGIHIGRVGLCQVDGKGTTSTEGKLDVNLTVEATSEAGADTSFSLSE